MNSIDAAALHAVTDPLFDTLTAASQPGQAPFPLGPNPRLTSYYAQRPRCVMKPADFLAPSCLDAGDVEERLAALWREAGHPELAACAPRTAAAADALHALYEATRPQAEVSPYIYQMF